MNEIIPVSSAVIGGENIQAVDARKLHEFLGVQSNYTTWIQRRIEEGDFTEGTDFLSKLEESTGGRPSKEYLVSLDMGKHLCMMERNEKGKQARAYFIEVEKAFRNPKPMTAVELIHMQSGILLEQEKKIAEHDRILSEVQHKQLVQEARLNNYDGIDINGTPRQRLNSMIRKYAAKNAVAYTVAWEEFTRRFNTAYHTNLISAMNHYNSDRKRPANRPEYLEEVGRIEDAVRVADKMLN